MDPLWIIAACAVQHTVVRPTWRAFNHIYVERHRYSFDQTAYGRLWKWLLRK